jgi:hypothetical protein
MSIDDGEIGVKIAGELGGGEKFGVDSCVLYSLIPL